MASGFGPIPEAIRHEESGLISPVGIADGLARNIYRIRDDLPLRQRLGEAGRRVLQAHYTFAARVSAMEQELVALAQPAGARL